MASGIAHEINNPLAAIAGCAEGLSVRVSQKRFDADFFNSYLRIIMEEIIRCKNITSGMLSFVREAADDKRYLNVQDTLDKTLEVIGFQGRYRRVGIMKHYKNDSPDILGCEGELRQVFLSIITNALDAMEDRGTLTIETGMKGDALFVRISDTGTGMSQEHHSRIFDPFFTTKSEKRGTGLGLSVAAKIIANHKGSIEVSSKEGEGSTFTVNLPVAA
jgi:signal transduction histidine kinase